MNQISFRLAVLAGLLALGACSGQELTRNFGLTRDAPDEFRVTTQAPLSMPPDLNLRPPEPGAPRPQNESPRLAAEGALVPQAALGGENGGMSAGQQALIAAAGPAAPAGIRGQVADDAARSGGGSFVDRLMFWRSPPPQGGTVVDPARESQRLRENAALGRNPETGDTPIIQPKRGNSLLGALGSIF